MNNLDFAKNYTKQSQGNNIYVRPRLGNDGNTGKTPTAAVKTLAKALSLATANQNDTVYMMCEGNTGSNTTDYQSTGLNWNKDGVHLIGVGAADELYLGQRARVSNLSTAALPSPLFTLSANNCVISGIEFFHGVGATDLTTAATCVLVSGMRNLIKNCQISGMGDQDLDVTASSSLTVTGAENVFKQCYIGLDTIIRAEAIYEVYIGGNATRCVFEDCLINSYTSLTTFKAITMYHGSAHTLTVLKNCILNSETGRTSCVTVTGAIDVGPIAGHIVMTGGCVAGYAAVVTGGSAKVLINSVAGATDAGEAIASAT